MKDITPILRELSREAASRAGTDLRVAPIFNPGLVRRDDLGNEWPLLEAIEVRNHGAVVREPVFSNHISGAFLHALKRLGLPL